MIYKWDLGTDIRKWNKNRGECLKSKTLQKLQGLVFLLCAYFIVTFRLLIEGQKCPETNIFCYHPLLL